MATCEVCDQTTLYPDDMVSCPAAMKAEIERLDAENTILRGLAQKVECPHKQRGGDGVCRMGYPGCACADDLMAMFDLLSEQRD